MIGILSAGSRFLDLTTLGNCALWLDASDASTITHSGGAVSQINDKSGNSRHFTQGTSSDQPRINTMTMNGLNVLDFQSDRLGLGSSGIGRNVGAITLYFLARIEKQYTANDATVPVYPVVLGSGSSNQARSLLAFNRNSDYKPELAGQRSDGSSFTSLYSANTMPPGYAVYTAVFDFANADAFLFVNGVQVASETAYGSAGSTNDTNSLECALGAYLSTAHRCDCQIAELAVFHSAHDANTRALVWEYLNRKWGLPDVGGPITWQTPADIGAGAASLNNPSGQVVEYGWRFTSTSGTVNGIVFAEATCNLYSGETIGLDYINSDSAFQSLLNTCEYIFNASPTMLEITLTGLTKYQRYSVQIFFVDKRTVASLNDRRQRCEDAYGNVSADYRVGDEKYVMGEFIANGPTQKVFVRYTSGGGSAAASISLLVLRRFV